MLGWVTCPKCTKLGMLVLSKYRGAPLGGHYGVLHLTVNYRWVYHRIPVKVGLALLVTVQPSAPSILPI